ncbi:MAG TPA: DMT family transporter [Haliangiales bacterium]|nr:DMT family transporter [Haliangiales bacterium]
MLPVPLRGALYVATAAALWGLWPVWVRLGGHGGATATVALLTCGVVGLPAALWRARGRRRGRRAWLGMALLGVVDAGNVWCYFHALDVGAVAPAVLSHYLAPVFIALAAPAVLGEARHPRMPLALALAAAGTALLVISAPTAGAAPVGPALAFGSASAAFYAASVFIAKRIGGDFSDVELMVFHALLAGALLLPATGAAPPLGGAIAGGVLSSLVAGVVYFAGLRRIPAERAGILAYLEPLVAVLVGWIAFAEVPSPLAAIGGSLIVGGGALVIVFSRDSG